MPRYLLAIALALALPLPAATAGEWLGGQYWGHISGCGHCGGSLYGWGRWYGAHPHHGVDGCGVDGCGAGDCGVGANGGCCEGCHRPDAPQAIPDAPQASTAPPLRQASYADAGRTSRRVKTRRAELGPITPITPIREAENNDVKVITHRPRPERLAPPAARIVAPNAWSGRLYR